MGTLFGAFIYIHVLFRHGLKYNVRGEVFLPHLLGNCLLKLRLAKVVYCHYGH